MNVVEHCSSVPFFLIPFFFDNFSETEFSLLGDWRPLSPSLVWLCLAGPPVFSNAELHRFIKF